MLVPSCPNAETAVTASPPLVTARRMSIGDSLAGIVTGVASANVVAPGARWATWIVLASPNHASAAVPSAPVPSRGTKPLPGNVWIAPNDPPGGATRTETVSVGTGLVVVRAIQATTRVP